MDVHSFISEMKSLSDDDLFVVLDAASEEMKRRNGLLGPAISSVRSNSVEENMKLVIDAIASVKQNTK